MQSYMKLRVSLVVITARSRLFTRVEYELGSYVIYSHFCLQSNGQFSQQGTVVGCEGSFPGYLYSPKDAGDPSGQYGGMD